MRTVEELRKDAQETGILLRRVVELYREAEAHIQRELDDIAQNPRRDHHGRSLMMIQQCLDFEMLLLAEEGLLLREKEAQGLNGGGTKDLVNLDLVTVSTRVFVVRELYLLGNLKLALAGVYSRRGWMNGLHQVFLDRVKDLAQALRAEGCRPISNYYRAKYKRLLKEIYSLLQQGESGPAVWSQEGCEGCRQGRCLMLLGRVRRILATGGIDRFLYEEDALPSRKMWETLCCSVAASEGQIESV